MKADESEELEILVSMILDMINNPKIRNGQLVRTLMYCIAIIAIHNDVDIEIVSKNFREVYKRLSIALGTDSWFPPGQA